MGVNITKGHHQAKSEERGEPPSIDAIDGYDGIQRRCPTGADGSSSCTCSKEMASPSIVMDYASVSALLAHRRGRMDVSMGRIVASSAGGCVAFGGVPVSK